MKNSVAVNLLSQMFLAQFSEEEYEALGMAIDALNELSTHRPRGKWVEDTYGWVYCSHCKKYLDDYQMVFFLKPFDYCPHCGSEMRGDDNDIR